MAAGMTVGAVLGMLYAPTEGAETRRKLRRLKERLSRHDGTVMIAYQRQELTALRDALQAQLDKLDEKTETK